MSFGAASAEASSGNQHAMSAFSGKTVVSVNHVAVNNDTAANTGSECVHHKVFHAFGAAVYHFANRCGIGIVGQGNCREFRKFFFQQGYKVNYSAERKVGSVFNSPVVIIAVWCTNADTQNFNVGIQ